MQGLRGIAIVSRGRGIVSGEKVERLTSVSQEVSEFCDLRHDVIRD